MLKRASIAAALLAAGISIYIGNNTIPGGGEPPAANVANLWMDADGGTCTRQSTAGDYVDAGACATIGEAYAAASCGDTVRIKHAATGYSAETIDEAQKNCSNTYVTFTPAVGEVANFGNTSGKEATWNICGGDWMKFLGSRTGETSDFTFQDGGDGWATINFGTGVCNYGTSNPVDHIWFEGMSFERFVNRGADQITFKDNDIAPGKTNHFDETNFVSVAYNGTSYVNNYPEDMVFDGNDIHGFSSELCRSGAPGGNDCHVECFTGEVKDIIVRNNWVYDCGNSGGWIFSSDAGFYTTGTANIVENNFFGSQEIYPFVPGSTAVGAVLTVRNNTFDADGGGNDTPDSSYAVGQNDGVVNWYGNVFQNGNGWACADSNGGDFEYNVTPSSSTGCKTGTGVVQASTTFAGAYPDFHLAAGQAAQDAIPGASCFTTTDLEGDARPQGTDCDAGADER